MSIYSVGTCDYCSKENEIVRGTPFMADVPAKMCEYCWNETKEEYAGSTGEHIVDFNSKKEEYEKIKRENKTSKVNKYLIVMRDYDNFIISIEQDINRPNNPDDYEIIFEYMKDNFMGTEYEVIDLSDLESLGVEEV